MDLLEWIIGAAIAGVIISIAAGIDCNKNVESIETNAPAYTTTR